jgi:hypothetical protein
LSRVRAGEWCTIVGMVPRALDGQPPADRPSSSGAPALDASVEAAIGARYQLEARLGEGSSGVVYRAIERATGARVALKTLRSVGAEQIALLKNEFRAVQGLQHPNLVQVGELFEVAGQFFLSMEYVDGTDFLTHVRGTPDARGGFHEGKLRAALLRLASALAALHGMRTVHRDIKPSNVLVTEEGRVVVLDFGLAMQEERAHARDEGILGTLLYMAPEQALGEAVGPPADWYAVGVMLFRALTGAFPFEGGGKDVLSKKLLEKAPSPRDFARDLPDDLVTFCEELLRMEPADRPTDREILSRLGATSEPEDVRSGAYAVPFLGRTREMAWLRRAFDETRGTREAGARAVILHGESGVGKSILLRTFAERLGQDHPDLLTLFSRCYERESVPFKAFDGATETLVGVLDAMSEQDVAPWLSAHAGLLPRILPELGLVRALAERAPRVVVEEPQEARRCAFEALRKLLFGLAESRPVMLVIDDLQWADADSLALLRAILDPPNAPPLLLVCTLRVGTDDAAKEIAEFSKLPGEVRSLQLDKLPPGEAASFVNDLLAHEEMSVLGEADVEAIVREAGGHPMFLSELVFQRKSDERGGRHQKLDDALRARVQKLPAAAQRLLEIVCVAGIPIVERAAADAASVEGAELMGALPRLRTERLVQTWGEGRATTIEPYHDRVRESVFAALSPEQRRAKHARLALALERCEVATEPEVLARHWLDSGDRDRARAYVRQAAEKAVASLAFERAAGFYAQALELCAAEDERQRLKIDLVEALTNAGHWNAAAELRLELAADAEPVRALQLRTFAAEQFLCSGRFERGAMELEAVLRAVSVHVPRSPWGTLLALLVSRILLRLRGMRYRLRASPLPPEEAVHIDPLISAGSGYALTDTVLGSYFNTRGLLRALSAGDPERLVRALGIEVGFSSAEGAKTEGASRAILERLRALANTVDTPFARAMVLGTSGWREYFLQNWGEAKRDLLAAERMFGELCVGQFWTRATTRTLAFRAMMQLGERAELAEHVARALREMEQIGDLYGVTNLRSGPLAWLRLVDDEPDLGAQELELVKVQLPTSRFIVQTYFHLLATAQLSLYRGAAEEALRRMEESWRPLRWSLLLRVSVIRVQALDFMGRVALAAAERATGKERERRLRLAEGHAAQLARLGYACSDGLAALLLAGARIQRSRLDEAAVLAREAVRAFEAAQMKLHVAVGRWYEGQCTGGEAGAQIVAQARRTMEAAGVRRPELFGVVLAPCLK